MPESPDDPEIRAAAAEAGISPSELRHALARRDAAKMRGTGPIAMAEIDGTLADPPARALVRVCGAIERSIAARGHAQGPGRADIVDERSGLTYSIAVQDDGSGGAYVQVRIDGGQAAASRLLTTTAHLALGGLVVLGGVMTGAPWLWAVGAGWMALGTASAWLRARRDRHGIARARAIATTALQEEPS
jgi:hypothetical protein